MSASPEVRSATPDDAEAVLSIYGPIVRDTVISFELEAPTIEEMRGRIAAARQAHGWLVAEDAAGSMLGYAYAGVHRNRAAYQWSTDVSVYVAPHAHRRGVGRALYEALFPLLVRRGYWRAFAGITLPNAASVGLHESLGFMPVGVYRRVGYKFGAWHDTRWWERSLRDGDGEPPALR